MRKYLLLISALILTIIITGCKSTEFQAPPPKKIVTLYSNKDDFNSIPGTKVTGNDLANIRTQGSYERNYSGVYIDPNTGARWDEGEFERITESPHWNLRPNPDVKPYEVDAAYKHIKNLANATPLAAELKNKFQTTKDLNQNLKKQISSMQSAKEILLKQNKELKKYNQSIQEILNKDAELKAENSRLKLAKNQNVSKSLQKKQTKPVSHNTQEMQSDPSQFEY